MADPDFAIGQNDTLPSIQATLYIGGLAVDLTQALGVEFVMAPAVNGVPSGAPKVDTDAAVASAASGVVRYDWAVGDTDTAGDYVAKWRVTWIAGGKTQSFPTVGYHTITVEPDLDPT